MSPKWSLSFSFPHQNPAYASPLPHTPYMLRPYSSRLCHPNNIGWAVQIIKLLIMLFSSLPCYLDPLRPKYSPQHPILQHTINWKEWERNRSWPSFRYCRRTSEQNHKNYQPNYRVSRNKQLRNLCNKHAYYPLEHNTWCYPLFTPDIYKWNFCWQFRFIPQIW